MTTLWGRTRPLIVAHRGSSGVAPENTVAAFRRAAEDGADMVELDARMTKDFEIVVLHDRSVRRTTNGQGKIWDLTLADLRTLDAGSWFSRRFAGERIPTLRHILDILPAHVAINIEVKTDGDPRWRPALQELLILQIRERHAVHRCIISSFDHRFLRRLNAIDPAIQTGVLYYPVRDFGKKPSSLAQRVGAGIFTCSIGQLTRKIAADLDKHHIPLGCYGVNTPRHFKKAVDYGASVIITDHPKEMLRLLSRQAS